ncbi:RDD family protein [Gemella cuniculi]|uniref:RDD family protein n=1 Tax=Gemella cuniculi TaxID=150240 RepID=UPI00041A10B3|nr:RDD family protein [Gemella cuniculi]
MGNKELNSNNQNFEKINQKEVLKNITVNQNLEEQNNFNGNDQSNLTNQKNDFSLPTSLNDYLILSKNFYAGFWLRFIAYIIDLVVILSISSLVNTFSFNLLNININVPIIGERTLSYIIIMFSYFIIMTYFFSQTLGKIIMKIKVEPNKSGKLTFSEVFFREVIGRLLTIALVYLPYLAVIFNSKKKGLHDYISDTVVVKEDFSNLRSQMNKKIESMNQN